jgi:hypothetical protein
MPGNATPVAVTGRMVAATVVACSADRNAGTMAGEDAFVARDLVQLCRDDY